jgi:hypothetical protein
MAEGRRMPDARNIDNPSGTMYFKYHNHSGQCYEEDAMRRSTILLAILMLLSSTVVFADDEKPAKEKLKELDQDVMKAAREVGKAGKKAWMRSIRQPTRY